MTIKKNNILVVLSKEDLDILEKAYDILWRITTEQENADANDVDINIVNENNDEICYDNIESACFSLGDILWNRP